MSECVYTVEGFALSKSLIYKQSLATIRLSLLYTVSLIELCCPVATINKVSDIMYQK